MRSRIDSPATLRVYRFEIPYSAGGRHIIIENATRFVAHVALTACADVAQVNANRATTIPPFATTRVDLSPSELPRAISLYLDPRLYTTVPAPAQWIDVRDADPVMPGVSVPVGVEGKVESTAIISRQVLGLASGAVDETYYTLEANTITRMSLISYEIWGPGTTFSGQCAARLYVDMNNILWGVVLYASTPVIVGSAMIDEEYAGGRQFRLRVINQTSGAVSFTITAWGKKYSIT